MARCEGRKADGSACERIVGEGQRWCFSHHPARAGERTRNAARAGRARHKARSSSNFELPEMRERLRALMDDAVDGHLEAKRATSAAQLANAFLRTVEIEHRQLETAALEERLEALERELERRGSA